MSYEVRLGKSGLKVSRIILGTMQYGDTRWEKWVIDDEQEVIRHIKTAYGAHQIVRPATVLTISVIVMMLESSLSTPQM
jgi:hypothetical protein